jgi:hypothetical protein
MATDQQIEHEVAEMLLQYLSPSPLRLQFSNPPLESRKQHRGLSPQPLAWYDFNIGRLPFTR